MGRLNYKAAKTPQRAMKSRNTRCYQNIFYITSIHKTWTSLFLFLCAFSYSQSSLCTFYWSLCTFHWWSMKSVTKDLDLIRINALILIRNKNGTVTDYEECVLNSLQTIKPHFRKWLMYNFCFNDYFYTLFNSII